MKMKEMHVLLVKQNREDGGDTSPRFYVQSEFSVNKVRQKPIRTEMEELPSVEKLCRAISKIRNGKAAGESAILPEMVKAACSQVK